MHVLHLHDWDISIEEAGRLQRELAASVVRAHCPVRSPLHVGGVDVSVDRAQGRARAAAVVLSFPQLELVEVKTAQGTLQWPYVPGFLSFRELPLVLAACELLVATPDIVLVDGQGIAHPRRFGLASHLGLFLDIPTVGCAKSLLCGTHGPLAPERGAMAEIVHDGEVVGAAVRTRSNVNPVYVSIGHRCSFADAVESVLHCSGRYRLPEPTRLAHLAAGGRLPG